MRVALACLALSLATGCASVDYDGAQVGRFEGSVWVMWVGEGNRLGAGRFVYAPAPGDPLRFVRANGEVLEPEVMYTDGGSIPRTAQLFRGFSPWGYAPAYMVHDWVFVARRCRTDGMATPAEAALAEMTFADTALIAAEAIKTLIAEERVAPNDVAPRVISGTVGGPISLERWTVEGGCAQDRLTPEHQARVDEAFFRATVAPAMAPEPAPRVAPGEPEPIIEPAQGDSARIVSVISF